MTTTRAILPLAVLLAAAPAAAADNVAVTFLGGLHFPLLHFPIALFFVAALVEVGLRWRLVDHARREVVRALVTLAAASAVATVVTGLANAQGEDFTGGTVDTFNIHRAGGIALAVVGVVLTLAARSSGGLRRLLVPLMGVACLLVTVVGHEGGELVHGKGYLTKAFRPDDAPKTRGHDDDDAPRGASDGDEGDEGSRVRERSPEGALVEKPTYAADIAPLFKRSCLKCHGPEKRKGGLRLDQKRFAMKGGETGQNAIIPGNAEKSLVFVMSAHAPDDEDVMPPKGRLLALSEIEIIKRWIDQGAAWPDTPETP